METLRFSNFLDPYIQTMPDSMQDGMLYRLTYAENLTRLTFYVTFPQLVPATDFFSLEETLQALEIETVRIAPPTMQQRSVKRHIFQNCCNF